MNNTATAMVLVVRSGAHTCALNLSQVLETMRPLPIEPVAGAPEIVVGLSVIRGAAVPVIALAGLFGEPIGPFRRWVVVRAGERRVAVAVEDVLGIRELSGPARGAMPPLVQKAAAGALQAIGALDSELLFVLNSASLVPDELLASLTSKER